MWVHLLTCAILPFPYIFNILSWQFLTIWPWLTSSFLQFACDVIFTPLRGFVNQICNHFLLGLRNMFWLLLPIWNWKFRSQMTVKYFFFCNKLYNSALLSPAKKKKHSKILKTSVKTKKWISKLIDDAKKTMKLTISETNRWHFLTFSLTFLCKKCGSSNGRL